MAPFVLPELPYSKDALAPIISAETFNFHHGKHHKAYVDKLNDLVKGTPFATMSLVEIIRKTHGDESQRVLFNNAAQTWNHTFFWNSMVPGGSKPSDKMMGMINASFGDFETMKKQFAEAANTQFGSGWAWLVAEGDKLSIKKTSNAETPLVGNAKPLLTVDVWEHAYYLDYQNRRPDYTKAVIDNLMNWAFAEANLTAEHK